MSGYGHGKFQAAKVNVVIEYDCLKFKLFKYAKNVTCLNFKLTSYVRNVTSYEWNVVA